jgi:hypothetical protein
VLLLWCFGIALIAERSFQAEHPDRSQETEDSSPAVGKRWKTAAAHKMFGSTSKMYKTIYLTYLSVIWATKGDVGVADDEAIEGIQIAIRTLQSMDQTTLLAWPRTTANVKSTIPRLPSKILRTNINPTVQFGALGFYALAVGNILSSEIITKYEQCLISLPRLVDASCLDETFSVSFPLFSVSPVLSRLTFDCSLMSLATHSGSFDSDAGQRNLGRVSIASKIPSFSKLHNNRRTCHEDIAKVHLASRQSIVRNNITRAAS